MSLSFDVPEAVLGATNSIIRGRVRTAKRHDHLLVFLLACPHAPLRCLPSQCGPQSFRPQKSSSWRAASFGKDCGGDFSARFFVRQSPRWMVEQSESHAELAIGTFGNRSTRLNTILTPGSPGSGDSCSSVCYQGRWFALFRLVPGLETTNLWFGSECSA